MSLQEERRRFPRLNDRIIIHYRYTEKKNADMGNAIKGFSKNISAGGLMFESDRSIPAQAIFNLEIYQPLRNSNEQIISIPALAKVKWKVRIDNTNEDKGSNKYRIGAEFLEIDAGERNAIAKYVKGKISA